MGKVLVSDSVGISAVYNDSGTLTINGGTFTHNAGSGDFEMGGNNATSVSSTLNLNGGTLITNRIDTDASSGTQTINFNGGILQSTVNDAAFLGG